MTLPLTVETVAAAYEYLRTTPPFNRWNLPDADEVKFEVLRTRERYADYYFEKGRHTIRVSAGKIGRTETLLASVAHEMVHLHHKQAKIPMPGDGHGAAFRKHAAWVCRIHGWDPKCF